VISGLSLLPAFAVRHPVCIRPSCTSWSRRLSRTAPGRGLDHAPPWWVTSPPPQGPSLGSGLFCPGPSSLNRPHPPHSQVHRDFTACRLIRDAFAVRERLGDPRAVPGFRCSFLPGMPSSPTPGRPASKCSRASMPTWPSPFDHRLGTPKIPAIRSTRASHFVASLVRFRYGLPGCSPPYTDQTGTPQPSGTFTSRLSTDRSPSPPLDITTTATGLLCWRDSHPLEWQLASLHGQKCEELALIMCRPVCPRYPTLLSAVGRAENCRETDMHFASLGRAFQADGRGFSPIEGGLEGGGSVS